MSETLDKFFDTALNVGRMVAEKQILGSQRASELELQQERVYYGKLNGSGPVNAPASLLSSPMSWTDAFFGVDPSSQAPAAQNTAQQARSRGGMLLGVVAVVVVIALAWWLWKRAS